MEDMDELHRENLRKLKLGLPYLLEHNREHVKNIQTWIERAKDAHQDGVVDDLQNVLKLSRQINEYFERALDKLEHNE
ncbi:MAG: hypothetical protein JRI95_13305 [Deltaproteobacteria bacterium]|nr:hypothetical protein [Deltaproteobacteria bacterium]MBW2085873.1 hypothetical protein [Deltaproteobacteria bacterium]